ncbi:transposase family protein [Streptomyces microflavus]|uniref:transposase family protein n=1 Tax=Streptomyces microflavus TaxID=1919 RepID=UPI0033B8C4A1
MARPGFVRAASRPPRHLPGQAAPSFNRPAATGRWWWSFTSTRTTSASRHTLGKHKRHGMNIQALTDPFGRLRRASPALPGSTHDLTAARQHRIIDALAAAGLKCWADKAYQGAGRPVHVPFRGRHLKQWKRRHNTTHAKTRCLGEQAMAPLTGWRLPRKLRCSTNRITAIVQAVLVLHHASA